MRPLLLGSALLVLAAGAASTIAACSSPTPGSSATSTDTGQDWPDDTSCAAWCVCNGVPMKQMLFGCDIGASCADLYPDAGADGGACECVQYPQ